MTTFGQWVDELEGRHEDCAFDAWQAGARAMLGALIERGFIAADYADIARQGVADILGNIEQ